MNFDSFGADKAKT